MTVPTVNISAEAHIYVCRRWINLKPTHYIWQRRAVLSALPFSFTFSSHLSDCAPLPRLSLPSALIISFSIDLLPLHPLLLNARLINYCPPQILKWESCQAEFSRLRGISIVFAPSSFRAHQLVLKHSRKIKLFSPEQIFFQDIIQYTVWRWVCPLAAICCLCLQ